MSSNAHLSNADLLRVRDGRPHGLGEARSRPLKELRTHVKGCLQCSVAMLELHYARVAMQQRRASTAHPGAANDDTPSLRALLDRRDVPPPSQWSRDPSLPGPINRSRYLIAGFVLVVAAGSAWFLRPGSPIQSADDVLAGNPAAAPGAIPTAAPAAPAGGLSMTTVALVSPAMVIQRSLELQRRVVAVPLAAEPAPAQALRARITTIDSILGAAATNAPALTANEDAEKNSTAPPSHEVLWGERMQLQEQVLAMRAAARSAQP